MSCQWPTHDRYPFGIYRQRSRSLWLLTRKTLSVRLLENTNIWSSSSVVISRRSISFYYSAGQRLRLQWAPIELHVSTFRLKFMCSTVLWEIGEYRASTVLFTIGLLFIIIVFIILIRLNSCTGQSCSWWRLCWCDRCMSGALQVHNRCYCSAWCQLVKCHPADTAYYMADSHSITRFLYTDYVWHVTAIK